MSSTKTTPSIPNLPLHLLIEKHAQDIKYGSVTYTCQLVGGKVEMKTMNITVAKRKRGKQNTSVGASNKR